MNSPTLLDLMEAGFPTVMHEVVMQSLFDRSYPSHQCIYIEEHIGEGWRSKQEVDMWSCKEC